MCEMNLSCPNNPVQSELNRKALELKQQAEQADSAQLPVVFIKRAEHRRRLGGISRTKEWQLLRDDPDHPKPVEPFGYVEHESAAYIARKIAQRDAAA
jgi:hypothetical protein